MSLSNPTFAATNLSHGLDADKPISCKAGDIYIAEDTGKVYSCFIADTWKYLTPNQTSSGFYIGDNTTNRAILHSLNSAPARVINVRLGGSPYIMYSTTTWQNLASGGATLTVTEADDTSFYVSNGNQDVNETGQSYYWMAFQN